MAESTQEFDHVWRGRNCGEQRNRKVGSRGGVGPEEGWVQSREGSRGGKGQVEEGSSGWKGPVDGRVQGIEGSRGGKGPEEGRVQWRKGPVDGRVQWTEGSRGGKGPVEGRVQWREGSRREGSRGGKVEGRVQWREGSSGGKGPGGKGPEEGRWREGSSGGKGPIFGSSGAGIQPWGMGSCRAERPVVCFWSGCETQSGRSRAQGKPEAHQNRQGAGPSWVQMSLEVGTQWVGGCRAA